MKTGSNGCARTKLKQCDGCLPQVFPEVSVPLTCVIIFSLASVCFVNSLDGGFVFDDAEAVVNNEDVRTSTPFAQLFNNDFWGTNIRNNKSHKSYRPLTVLSFRLNYMLRDRLNAWDFHLTNLLLHSTVSCCSIVLFTKIFDETRPRLSFASSAIFAVHPVHTEAVVSIVGRADLLCSLFYFLSIFTYARHLRSSHSRHLFLSMIYCTIAMLCKEQGITVLGINAAYDLIVFARFDARKLDVAKLSTWKPMLERYLWMALVGSILLYGRVAIMGSSAPAFQHVDNPASYDPSWLTRVLSYNYIYSIHALLLILPHWLCFDWSMGCIPLLRNICDTRNLASVALWALLLGAVYRALFSSSCRRRRLLTLGLALTCVPFLPATNLFFRVGFVVAERVLFIPVAGYCVLFVYGLEQLHCMWPYTKVWRCCMLSALLLYACKSCHRGADWKDESQLFRSALKVCPLNAKVHYNIAKNAADEGLRDLAVAEYRTALRLHPDYDQAMNNLANLLKDIGQISDAEKLLLHAVRVRPDFAAAWMNLGIVQALLAKFEDAGASYLTALNYRRKYPDCYYNLGNLYLELKRYDEALDSFRTATTLQPSHVLAWTNMIVMLDNIGHSDQAESAARHALDVLPNEANLHFSLAGMLGKQGRFAESEYHFIKALDIRPRSAIYHTNLGVLYHRWKKYDQAERCYNHALQIDAGLKSAMDNLNLLHKSRSKVA